MVILYAICYEGLHMCVGVFGCVCVWGVSVYAVKSAYYFLLITVICCYLLLGLLLLLCPPSLSLVSLSLCLFPQLLLLFEFGAENGKLPNSSFKVSVTRCKYINK